MKVTKTTTTKSETSSELDLFSDKKLTARQKKEIRSQVGEYIVEQTAIAISKLQSPIEGGEFKKTLSPLYKKKKESEVGTNVPNLEYEGIMLDELSFEETDKGIKVGVFGERAPAADGHNNLSGDSQLPARQFLPKEGEEYKSKYKSDIERIISDVVAETTSFKKKDFEDVNSSKSLYDTLSNIFGKMTRAELKLAVFRNESLLDFLEDMDLVEYL